eukprot:gene9970-biopygen15381
MVRPPDERVDVVMVKHGRHFINGKMGVPGLAASVHRGCFKEVPLGVSKPHVLGTSGLDKPE